MKPDEVPGFLDRYDSEEDLVLMPRRYFDWMRERDRGLIAEQVMLFLVLGDPFNPGVFPRDEWDLRKLMAMCRNFPELEARVGELADVSPQWKAIVENWSGLRRAYDAFRGGICSRFDLGQALREVLASAL